MTKPLSALFHPRPDITVHELALIVRGFLLSGPITIPAENWARIPPTARRHLDLRENVERIGTHEFVEGSLMCAHCGVTRYAMDDGLAPSCPGPANPAKPDGGHLWVTLPPPDEFAGCFACSVCGLLKEAWAQGIVAQVCPATPAAISADALEGVGVAAVGMISNKPTLTLVPAPETKEGSP